MKTSIIFILIIIAINVNSKSLKSSAEIQQNEEEQKLELKEGLARLQNISKQFLGPNSKSKGKLFMTSIWSAFKPWHPLMIVSN